MSLPKYYDYFREYIDEKLNIFLNSQFNPSGLTTAMNYSLLAGGKRIRPVLLYATFFNLTNRLTCCTCPSEKDMNDISPNPIFSAIALEAIHTYSLIHDDLPAMDNDDFRRGKLTLHKISGEDMAILAGDALLTSAAIFLGDNYYENPKLAMNLTTELYKAAFEMVEGQVLDTVKSERQPEKISNLHNLVDKKTGALLRVSLKMGGILANISRERLNMLNNLGIHLGRLFQITDDMLDVKGTREEIGKTPGKEHKQKKLTYVTISSYEDAEKMASLEAEKAYEHLKLIDMDTVFFSELINFIQSRTY